jgi:hypothetical protein
MEEYNQLIASHLLDGIERGIIKSTPQPTMFGGKRMRKWVLPGSTESDYPGTLSVGSLDGSRSDTIGGSFWKDFGHGFKTGFTGTAKVLAPIAVPIAKELLLAKMRGAGYDSDCDDDYEGGMMVGADGHGIYHGYPTAQQGGMIVGADGHGIHHGAYQMAEQGVSRADGGAQGGYFKIGSRSFGKKHGGAMLGGEKDQVREYMKAIGSVINPALLVGLGRPGEDGHGVRTMGGASSAEKAVGAMNPLLWGYDLGKNVIGPAMIKVTGRGRMVKGSPEAKAYMASIRAKKMTGGAGSKPAGYIRRLVAEKTKAPPFDIEEVGVPSVNLQAYAKSARVRKGRPQKHGTPEEAYQAKLLSNKIKRAEKRAMAKAQKEGGAMIMNHPDEFHSSTYPPALASYKHQMAVGGKKSSFLGDMGKAFAPVAKDVFVPLAKEMATDYIRGKARGGKKSSFLGDLGKAFAPVAKDVIIPVGKELATEFIRNKMRGGKKSSFLGDLGRAVAPVAKDVFVPLAKEMATDYIRGKARGGKKSSFLSGLSSVGKALAPVAKDVFVPLAKEVATEAIRSKMRGGARSARNEIVKQVMQQMQMSLPMASKYVKENGLY